MSVNTEDEESEVSMRDEGEDEDEDESCTCKKCLGNWLSPRTAYHLHTRAAVNYDLSMDLFDDLEGMPMSSAPLLEYIPRRNRPARLTRSFIVGYYQCFLLICEVLESGKVPTRDNLYDAIGAIRNGTQPPRNVILKDVKTFLERCDEKNNPLFSEDDGIDFVLHALVDTAKDEEDWGYQNDEEFTKLSTCRNDTKMEDWSEILEWLTD